MGLRWTALYQLMWRAGFLRGKKCQPNCHLNWEPNFQLIFVRADSQEMEDDKPTLNFAVKKTESGWQDAFDRFWLSATPKLFEWFRWVIALAAFGYVAKKADSTLLQTVVNLANTAVMFYYFAFFSQFQFLGLPFIKTRRSELLASVILSGGIAVLTYGLVRYSIYVLIESQP